MLNRKIWLGAFAAAALLAPGIASAQSDDPFRLIVTHLEPPLVPNSVMDLAVELGYFEQEGVDVELVRVQQTPSAVAAMQAGEGEMANIGVDALLQLHAQDNDNLIAVTSPNKSLPFLIASQDSIGTLDDLEGASFGVGRIGSLDYSLSTTVFEDAGLDVDSLDFLTLGQPNVRAQALAAGQVDATTMSIGVWLSIPDKEGLQILVNQEDYYNAAPIVNKVNVVPQAVLENRREDVVSVLRALVRISRDFNETPMDWVDAMEPLVETARADLEQLAQSFQGSWSVNGGMSTTELEYTQEQIYMSEDFADLPQVELASWTDFSLLDDVLDDLGVDESADSPDR